MRSPAERKLRDLVGHDIDDAGLAILLGSSPSAAQRLAGLVFVERFGRLVNGIARRCSRRDAAAAAQDGWVAALEAAGRFDPARGVPLAGYIAVAVKGAILNSTRGQRRHERKVAKGADALLHHDGPIPKPEGEPSTDLDPARVAEQLRVDGEARALIATLPTELERDVARQLYEAPHRVERAELASEHEVTLHEVDTARERVRRRFADLAAQLGIRSRQRAPVIRLADRRPAAPEQLNRTKAA